MSESSDLTIFFRRALNVPLILEVEWATHQIISASKVIFYISDKLLCY